MPMYLTYNRLELYFVNQQVFGTERIKYNLLNSSKFGLEYYQ